MLSDSVLVGALAVMVTECPFFASNFGNRLGYCETGRCRGAGSREAKGAGNHYRLEKVIYLSRQGLQRFLIVGGID
jgi:hypothetical protein